MEGERELVSSVRLDFINKKIIEPIDNLKPGVFHGSVLTC